MSETNREMPNLTWYAMCVYMKSDLTVVGSCLATHAPDLIRTNTLKLCSDSDSLQWKCRVEICNTSFCALKFAKTAYCIAYIKHYLLTAI